MGPQLCMFIVTAVVLVAVLRLVARGRLLLRYSLIWIILFIVTFLATIFPEPLFWLATAIGFQTPSNFVLVMAIFFLLAICLSLSVIASRNRISTKNLVQSLAIQEALMNRLQVRVDALEARSQGGSAAAIGAMVARPQSGPAVAMRPQEGAAVATYPQADSAGESRDDANPQAGTASAKEARRDDRRA